LEKFFKNILTLKLKHDKIITIDKWKKKEEKRYNGF